MTTNYKSTVGGSFSALGSVLMGIGIVPQLNGTTSSLLTKIALAGFICNAIGAFLGHLFAADAKMVMELNQKVQETQAAISVTKDAVLTGDTELLRKSDVPPLGPVDK